MRLFIALKLPAEVRARITAEVRAPLRERLPDVRWVREGTLHLTLLFLGERSEAEAREMQAVVREVAAARTPFTVSLAGLGMFPGPARPRVVWLGVAEPAPVQGLYHALASARSRLGMPAEERAYKPHVTLGRVPPAAEAGARKLLGPALAAVRFEAPVAFRSVDLMRSELTPRGPRYTTLLAAPLGSREAR